MLIREHERLSSHTTLRTGGPSRFFIEALTEEDVREALRFAAARTLPVFILGSGSNVLAPDGGFPGVVIHMATQGIAVNEKANDAVEVVAEAGEVWDKLVAWSVARGLYGLENMSLIPGTVGAAVIGNIGAYGAEVKGTLVWAEALDLRSGVTRRFSRQECGFAYRWSYFKTSAGRGLVVVRAAFSLPRNGVLNTHYKDVADYLGARGLTTPTLASVREAVMAIRQRKLPDPAHVGTAGSFFKNPVIPRAQYKALAARQPGLPGHAEGDGRVKVPLGWILDKMCALKGVRHGHVGTHREQALVVVNEGGTAAEIEAFAQLVVQRVKEATDIDVEWEVERMPG